MSEDQGLVEKVPTDVWLAYDKRATDYAAMHGNGSAALKAGILRLTLDAWLSGQAHEPAQPISMWATVAQDVHTGEPVWRCNETDNRDGEHDEPVIELNPATFQVGTKVTVIEPDGQS